MLGTGQLDAADRRSVKPARLGTSSAIHERPTLIQESEPAKEQPSWGAPKIRERKYRPAHVHVKVSAPGFLPLTTQLYFPGDPYNAVDPVIVRSLSMRVADEGGLKRASFDFVLRRA